MLNSVDGTHAGGIAVKLVRIDADRARTTLFDVKTDGGGRLLQEVSARETPCNAAYELILRTGDYFDAMQLPRPGKHISREVVVRFEIPDPDARYHIPLMLAPNSYSVWFSG